MTTEVICAILSGLTLIVVAIINQRSQQEQKKNDEYIKRREREARLSMQINDACLQLSIATANAVLGGKNNGNVEKAYAAAEAARVEYMRFLQEVASHEIA